MATARATRVNRDDIGFDVHGAAWRRMALALAAVLILGCVGILFGLAEARRRRHAVFASGQVFASVGNSAGQRLRRRRRATQSSRCSTTDRRALHRRQRVRRPGQLLRDRRPQRRRSANTRPTARSMASSPPGCRTRSRSSSTTRATSTSASRPRPTSQSSPRRASSCQNIGPLATELRRRRLDRPRQRRVHLLLHDRGDRHPPLQHVHQPRSCPTSTRSPSRLRLVDGPAGQAFQLRSSPNGDVLVADSNADILLGPERQRHPDLLLLRRCPGCQGQLFAMSLDPDGNSFWTGDSTSGDIWQVDIASGNVLQTDQHPLGVPVRPLRRRPDRGGRSGPGRRPPCRRRSRSSRSPATSRRRRRSRPS